MADEDEIDAGEGPEAIIDPSSLKSSRGWLAMIDHAGRRMETYLLKCISIARRYADLERLASDARDREFQLFWANVQVLGPSIYSRPPIPVIGPRFKDGKPIPRTASELVERSTVTTFDTQDIDGCMRLVRDDLNKFARGVLWVRYEAKADGKNSLGQRTCIEWVHRSDFRHGDARVWAENDWVAKRSWLSKSKARKRFAKHSGDLYKEAAYEQRKDDVTGEADIERTAPFWEIWCKSQNRVYWVAEGCDRFLDESEPPIELQDFFPCPRPAYGTLQDSTLIPVPDMLLYKDQLEEINDITSRIAALSDALRLKGFYPGGAGELADAIESAMKRADDNAILIPVSNWALLGNGQGKDTIVWIPLDMVATTIQQLIELRKQLIDDVYQIMGLSDIMRGQSEASETLGAQELKSQYGSVRIRDKRDELVRMARDVTRICAEIMAENFTQKSLLDMSQMDIPTDADIKRQIKDAKAQFQQTAQQAMNDPQLMQQAQEKPEAAQQAIDEAQQQLGQQIASLDQTVTIEQVMKFLRDNRMRAFTLDIETDSTVTPDENAEKQRMTEYVTAMGGLLQQALPTVQSLPQAAPLLAEIIKKANRVFRTGRDFEQVVDQFADQMKQIAAAPKPEGPTPEQIAAQVEQGKAQLAAQQQQIDAQAAQSQAQLAQGELQLRQQEASSKAQIEQAKIAQKAESDKNANITKLRVAMIGAKSKEEGIVLQAKMDEMLGITSHERETQSMQIEHQHQDTSQERGGEQARELAALKPAPAKK